MSLDPRKLPDMPELMIAGPGELHDEDLDVLGRQIIAHYGDTWVQLLAETTRSLGDLLGTSSDPYVIPGTGTASLDAAVANLFGEGDRVVVASTGFFGTRLAEVAKAHRLQVEEVDVEIGAPIEPARIAEVADGAAGVFSVHVETATGVRHPIDEIAKVARQKGALYLVDGIASVGGELVNVDSMGIDALVTGTQKGLEAPPGLGMVALSDRARERVASRKEPPRSWYLDFERWDWYRREWTWHPHPVTMPTNLVLALASSLQRILETGIETWVAQRADLAKRCREGLREIGLQPVPQPGVESNLVVAAYADDPAAIQAHLLKHEGIMISGGLTPLAGKTIRVGLMGRTATEEMVDRVLEGVRQALAATDS